LAEGVGEIPPERVTTKSRDRHENADSNGRRLTGRLLKRITMTDELHKTGTPDETPSESLSSNPPDEDPIPDIRLYLPESEDWGIQIKRDSERIYCYSKHPGEDWFHLILSGEIYLTRQHERFCLRCALRMGFLTKDRLFWQHRVPRRPRQIP
jgi:hypothetical protein